MLKSSASLAALSTVLLLACSSSEEGPSTSAGGTAGTTASGGNAGTAPLGGGGASAGTESIGGSAGGTQSGGVASGGSAGAVGGGGIAGSMAEGGTGGMAPAAIVLPAFTSSAAKLSTNMGTRNAGHQFTVTDSPIVVRDLGMYDSKADGLKAAHTVTLFSVDKLGAGAKGTPVPGGSVTIPAGTTAELEAGHRFAPLAAPVTLQPGNYAVIVYGLNADDLPGDGGSIPLPSTGIADGHFDPYEFVSTQSPAYPNGGDANYHANASFRFEAKVRPLRIMPLGASITNGYQGTMSGYRGPLRKLLEEAGVTFQYVGSYTDNPGTKEVLPREQQHHDGHSGFVIQAGTSGRSGILDNFDAWLGPTGSQADLFLIVIGTNDVDLNYKLDSAGQRLDAMVTKLFTLQPKAHVILAQLPPIDDAAEDVRCVGYNKRIVATVEAHQAKGEAISTVDLHSAITTDELADKLHPNDVGYGKVAKKFFDAIQALDLR